MQRVKQEPSSRSPQTVPVWTAQSRESKRRMYHALIKIIGPEDSPDALEKATNVALSNLEESGLAAGYDDVWIVDVKVDPTAGIATIFYKMVETYS